MARYKGAGSGGSRFHLLTARLLTEDSVVKVAWFNQSFLQNRLHDGMRVLISGKPKQRDGKWEFSNPKWMALREDEAVPDSQILPVYRLTEGMQPQQMRSIVKSALDQFVGCVEEVLPASRVGLDPIEGKATVPERQPAAGGGRRDSRQ